tara:strand:- start:19045 stop:19893 length:849 start_codon:yes stop_codon:yes gene_type:complete
MPECIVCNNKESFKKKLDILTQCNICNHIFADLELNYNDLKKIYSKDYFFGDEYIDYIEDRRQIEKNAKIRLNSMKKILLDTSNLNLLEIGCAYGFFLNTVKEKFNEVFGIDIHSQGIEYAKTNLKLKTKCVDFLNLKKDFIKKFNVFCMFDVIEHLVNPKKFINQIGDYAEKNSYIFITTGDISSLNARFKGKNWRLIHPPSHIHYFSKKTIKLLLENNGFELVSIQYCGYYRNLNFILNKINLFRKYFGFILKILSKLNLLKLDIYLNFHDIMFIVAIKK